MVPGFFFSSLLFSQAQMAHLTVGDVGEGEDSVSEGCVEVLEERGGHPSRDPRGERAIQHLNYGSEEGSYLRLIDLYI